MDPGLFLSCYTTITLFHQQVALLSTFRLLKRRREVLTTRVTNSWGQSVAVMMTLHSYDCPHISLHDTPNGLRPWLQFSLVSSLFSQVSSVCRLYFPICLYLVSLCFTIELHRCCCVFYKLKATLSTSKKIIACLTAMPTLLLWSGTEPSLSPQYTCMLGDRVT